MTEHLKILLVLIGSLLPLVSYASLTPQKLEELWNQRAQNTSVIHSWSLESPTFSKDYDTEFKSARLCYYSGFFISDEKSSAEKLKIFERGLKHAQEAMKLAPNRVEGYYWFAVNQGGHALEKGIVASLSNAGKMKEALDKAIEIDKSYFNAGPLRVRGRMYFRLPGGFISFGDNQKALEDLRLAVQLAPDYKLNYIYLAEVVAKKESKKQAVELLEKAKLVKDTAGEAEEKRNVEEIKRFMDKWK